MEDLLKILDNENVALMHRVNIIVEELYKIGNMYHAGDVAQDFNTAFKFYEKADLLSNTEAG